MENKEPSSGDLYKKIAFVVLSCDKYSDLWPVFFATFFDYWPDCPFQVYLVANQKKYPDKRVITLLSGEDADWSSSLKRAILPLKEETLFLFYEDAFLKERVSSEKLKAHILFFFEKNLDYLRLRPAPKPDEKCTHMYGRISEAAIYRVSLFSALCKKSVLLDLLKEGESAWEFEMKGTLRSYKYRAFYSTYRPFFMIIHGVERGKWINSAYRHLLRLGYKPDSAREFFYTSKLQESLRNFATGFKFRFINLFPASQHRQIIRWGGNIKRKLFRKN